MNRDRDAHLGNLDAGTAGKGSSESSLSGRENSSIYEQARQAELAARAPCQSRNWPWAPAMVMQVLQDGDTECTTRARMRYCDEVRGAPSAASDAQQAVP